MKWQGRTCQPRVNGPLLCQMYDLAVAAECQINLAKLKVTRLKMITLKMVDQGKSDFRVIFTMSLSALELKQMQISLPFEIIWLGN